MKTVKKPQEAKRSEIYANTPIDYMIFMLHHKDGKKELIELHRADAPIREKMFASRQSSIYLN